MSGDRTFFGLLEAAKKYRAGGPGPKLTLMVIMERMGDHGGEWSCWPSLASLAYETEMDARTIRRHLASFEAEGLIVRRPRGASGGGRGANDLVLNVERLTGSKPDAVSGGANRTPVSEQTGHLAVPLLSIEHPLEQPAEPSSDSLFARFWTAYPNHQGKTDARRAWSARVREGLDPETLITAAENYAHVKRGTEARFLLYPATFLGPRRRYEDFVEVTHAADPLDEGIDYGHSSQGDDWDADVVYS